MYQVRNITDNRELNCLADMFNSFSLLAWV